MCTRHNAHQEEVHATCWLACKQLRSQDTGAYPADVRKPAVCMYSRPTQSASQGRDLCSESIMTLSESDGE